jgi:hypothetical protein
MKTLKRLKRFVALTIIILKIKNVMPPQAALNSGK